MRKVFRMLTTVISVSLLAVATLAAGSPPVDTEEVPLHIYGGAWPTSHVQGVAIDTENGYMYWSFTQALVKTDLGGNVVGTVEGLSGHLGDLDFNTKDGRVYGSLEYKAEEAFYIAIFDVQKIDRVGMDAESDGVMTTVYLNEVVEDYNADMDANGVFDGNTANTPDHRYGCSGIDGVAFGPEFGKKGRKQLLTVAYGVYSNTTREDNDHQVLLQYDVKQWRKYEQPLSQSEPHRSGPESYDGKYFVYTGNTTYGVQNLEYDAHTQNWLMAVYPGMKEEFPNYSFFIVDGSRKPTSGVIRGQQTPETGELLSLMPEGLYNPGSGTFGWNFHGNTGIVSLDNGYYYVAQGKQVDESGVAKQDADVYLYHWTGATPTPFARVVTLPVG